MLVQIIVGMDAHCTANQWSRVKDMLIIRLRELYEWLSIISLQYIAPFKSYLVKVSLWDVLLNEFCHQILLVLWFV